MAQILLDILYVILGIIPAEIFGLWFLTNHRAIQREDWVAGRKPWNPWV